MHKREPERIETVVIGGGQAGLSVGYHLARRGLPFVILDASQRIGDSWRNRWDSLRLFTPAPYSGLAGMPFPGPAYSFPTKDEMADYLESYAVRFELPVRTGVRVDGLSRQEDRFEVTAGDQRWDADNVVVAMADYQRPEYLGSLAISLQTLCSCTQSTTSTPRSSRMAACSSLERVTREQRSLSRLRPATGRGCRGGTPAMCRSASMAPQRGYCCFA